MTTEGKVYDVIVVGAGIMGLWTSYTMVKKGLNVLLLDQFILPHGRGSSGGQSRMIRFNYEDEFYIDMVFKAIAYWRELEQASGEQLFRVTGFLAIVDYEKGCERLRAVTDTFKHKGVAHEFLRCEEMRDRFPMLRFGPGSAGLLDKNAGLLFIAKCNRVLLTEFLKHGGILHDGKKVSKIIPGTTVTVVTQDGEYSAKSLVLTPGPWAKELLLTLGLDLPMVTLPGMPCYFKENLHGSDNHVGMPVFRYELNVENGYQFVSAYPVTEYPGMVKVLTRGQPALTPAKPDDRDKASREHIIKFLSKHVRKFLPGLENTPSIIESCVYTRTPDGHYILDYHPKYSNIVIGAGGSGHAYKMGPVIGKLLTELSMGHVPSHDISKFRVTRFRQKARL